MKKRKDRFHVEDIFVGKTFNDFSIPPEPGIIEHRGEVSLKTKFSKNIELNFPLVAANMDTVTGPKMCIAIADCGGIGILPRSDAISINLQASWVREVKRAENLIIENPYKILETQKVSEARMEMERRGVGTLLVVDEKDELVGIITDDGIVLCFKDSEPIKEWMVKRMGGGLKFSKELISSIEEAIKELRRWNVNKLPLVDKDFRIKGLITSKDIRKLVMNKWANKDSKGRLRVGAAIGAVGDYLERAAELINSGVDVIVMDMAHAHNKRVTPRAIEEFRKKFGDFELVCGNIATFEGAKFLKDLGVQGVKVGIGSGHGCLTRIKTGIGVPQMHAVRASWQALKNTGIGIISDGGIKDSGDISKALAVGALSVMVGSILAGTEETPGEAIRHPLTGTWHKKYRGMTSPEAKLEGVGSSDDIKNVEGKEDEIPLRGSVRDVLRSIKENLQSMISFSGEENLENARKKFNNDPLQYLIPLSPAAIQESFNR